MANIHVVPTFHHDIAYLQPESVYTKMATDILDKSLSLMEQDETYTFTVEQAYFFREYFENHPEKHQQLIAFAQKGQLQFAPGFWSVPDMCMPAGESLYMQATMGKRLLKDTVGYEPRAALIADCWGHHAQLPQIMTQCGYDYYTFSRCMERDFAVENFRWQGLDGTTINTHWMSTAYAGISFPDDAKVVNAGELHWEEASKDGFMNLYNRNAQHCGDDTQVMPAGGDMKMPAASALGIMKGLQEDPEMPGVSFSSFERALSEIDFSQKPIYDKEFISSLKGTFATNIDIKHNNRALENGIVSLETLSVLKNQKADFTPLWDVTLKNQFHDILCGTICDQALEQVRREYDDALAQMEQTRKDLSAEGERGYFNPLPFDRNEVIATENGGVAVSAKGWHYGDETQLSQTDFVLPAVFENEFYKAELDERGFIVSLTEKETDTVLVNHPRIPFGSLVLQADSGDNWVEFEYPWELDATLYTTNAPDPYERIHLPTHSKVQLSRCGVTAATAKALGDDAVVITQTGALRYWVTNLPFTTTITLYKNNPRIDYHTEFDCNNRRLRLRVAFPNPMEGTIRHQIPFGMVERGEGPQPAQHLMDLQNDVAGLSLINKGLPANNTEGGMMMLTLFRSVAMEYKCQSELSYNLGQHIACDYAVLPHKAGNDTLLWQQSLAFQQPMVATTKEPLCGFGVEGAMVSALRFDGDDVFMRLYNGTAQESTVTITLPADVTAYAMTNGLMDAVTDQVKVNGQLTLTLPAYRVQGIKFFRE